MGIAADALVAAFNPALGSWHLSPIAVEIERHVVDAFCHQFGYEQGRRDGLLTTGGSEANHTALLTALVRRFPEYGEKGVRALPRQPILYISSEGHHSVLKAARLCGLGTDAIREIPVDQRSRMNCDALYRQVEKDKAEGSTPFLIVATAGTTSAGAIDPIFQLANYAAQEEIWLHVDAAWGGGEIGSRVERLTPWDKSRRLHHLRRP
jgi:glutamate/tyrosine decarboxylase-like PLP-dependent enzyme